MGSPTKPLKETNAEHVQICIVDWFKLFFLWEKDLALVTSMDFTYNVTPEGDLESKI